MISVENRVGRLVEAVLRSPITDEELAEFRDRRARVVAAIAGERAVCVDMTGAGVLSPDHAERLIDILKQRHGGPSRVAYLLPARAVATLQVERILREAQSPERRTFADRAALIEWLGEPLTVAERARLRTFLGAPDG
jgi:hypothetical protein